jgi:electron transfer flavoprotein beta subunit
MSLAAISGTGSISVLTKIARSAPIASAIRKVSAVSAPPADIMKARRKPMEELTAADLGVDLSPRLKVLRVSEPPPRPSGRKVADAQELVRVLREEAKVLS